MSRLDEEYIMAIVRRRSGIDAGEIDYQIECKRFEKQDKNSLIEIINTLVDLKKKCFERIDELDKKTSLG